MANNSRLKSDGSRGTADGRSARNTTQAKPLELQRRLELAKLLEAGPSDRELGRRFGVAGATLRHAAAGEPLRNTTRIVIEQVLALEVGK